MRRTFIALLVFALVATSVVAPIGAVAAESNQTDDGSEYTIDELRRGGVQYSNSPASMRIVDERIFWAVHWPANNPFSNPGEDQQWQFLESGQRVERNQVWLRTYCVETGGCGTETVKVVYWNQATRKGPNNQTQQVAENVSVATHKVSIETGRPTVKIPLRQHDQPTQVTMWLEDKPGARWTFSHESIATTQSTSIDSKGDYLAQVMLQFILPELVLGLVLIWVIKRLLEKAGRGPGWGMTTWMIVLTIGAGVVFFTSYDSLADLVVLIPTLLAGILLVILGLAVLEWFGNPAKKVLFVRPSLEFSQSPSGEMSFDTSFADVESHDVVTMPDGSIAVVKNGLLAFFSRVFGGAARLENAEQIATKIETPDSTWDEIIYVHPLATDVLEYEQEGWELSTPESLQDLAGFGTKAAIALIPAVLVWSAFDPVLGTLTGAGALLIALATPTDGYARVHPAPGHMTSAETQARVLAQETSDAETFDKAREELIRERLHTEQEVEDRLERSDRTLIEEAHDVDLERRLSTEDDEDEEDHTENERDPAKNGEEVPSSDD